MSISIAMLLVSILVPSFDAIMALFGSALTFTICVIFPLLFYLRLFESEMSRTAVVIHWVLIGICSLLAIMGTIWVFLPKKLIGVD